MEKPNQSWASELHKSQIKKDINRKMYNKPIKLFLHDKQTNYNIHHPEGKDPWIDAD